MRVMPGYLVAIVERTPEKTAGGLYLPEQSRKEKPVGIVDQVSADVARDFGISAGDKIVFDMYAGTSIVIEDIEYRFLKAVDVYAVL